MVFSSLVFLYGFLPLNLVIYTLSGNTRVKNIVLLIMSLAFYAWGEPVYVLLLCAVCFVNYFAALKIGEGRWKKGWLIFACAFSIGALAVFKYGGFIQENARLLFGFPEEIRKIALPIGISFYTFQMISYTADVYRGETEADRSFINVLTYASLFHQCVAGPIVRYSDIAENLRKRRASLSDISGGIGRFAVGLAKKAVLANLCGEAADRMLLKADVLADASLFAANLNTLSGKPAGVLWLGAILYMLQIYLDFSAYSDMAIGMGRMIGFRYKENFNYPYTACSVTDFWRRWHMSLSTFFRDYVYIPLGGSRNGKLCMITAMLAVWTLTGLWHGDSWNFVFWGLYYFVFLVIEKIFLKRILEKAPKVFGRVYTLLIVLFGWIIFRFENMQFLITVIKGLFCGNGNPFFSFETAAEWKNILPLLAVSVLACTPAAKIAAERFMGNGAGKEWARAVVTAVLVFLSTAMLVGNSYNPFIYFKF